MNVFLCGLLNCCTAETCRNIAAFVHPYCDSRVLQSEQSIQRRWWAMSAMPKVGLAAAGPAKSKPLPGSNEEGAGSFMG